MAAVAWLLVPTVAVASPYFPASPDTAAEASTQSAASPKTVRAQLDGLRVPFVANDGQFDPRVAYYVRTPGSALFVTRHGELVYSLRDRAADRSRASAADARRTQSDLRRHPARGPGRGWALTEAFVGGRTHPTGQDRGAASVSELHGSDPARWRSAAPTYHAVDLGEVWPGVTVSLRSSGGRIEKIFTVAPGGSVDRIRLRLRGAQGLSVGADGALVARTGLGDVAFTPPVAYQERAGVREPVSVSYRLEGRQYGFAVGAYDPALPLVIDPLLQSTFLGGVDDDFAYAIAIHPTTGDVYVTGETWSENFPGTLGGALPFLDTDLEGFVARLDKTLTVLLQATYFGGNGFDSPFAIAIHPESGDVYVAGRTDSNNLPNTGGAVQENLNGNNDAFIARFSGDLKTLVRATYLGGSLDNEATALGINRNPTSNELEVYVAGSTESDDFPGANNTLDTGLGIDAFVARLSSDLGTLWQSTYLGGTDEDRAYALGFHPITGAVYVAGDTFSTDFPSVAGGAQESPGGGCACVSDAFVAMLDSDLGALLRASYLGGSSDDFGNALVVDPAGANVYVAGGTYSANFPGTSLGAQAIFGGSQDAFVARLNSGLTPDGFRATYLGGSGPDEAWGLAIHPTTGELYVAGNTASVDFPSTLGGVQESYGGCLSDMFVTRLAADLASILQATYLGDAGCDEAFAIAISPLTGDVYVAGDTESPFPGTNHGAQPNFGGGFVDAVVARLTRSLTATSPDLAITKTHVGDFFRNQVGATYTITVTNVGTVPTDGTTVTVTDVVPAGLTPTGLAGPGWSCTLATRTCTRSTVLNPSASYPAITLTVDVAPGASPSVINTATVAGGGDETQDNNIASNPTTIVSAPDLTITKTHAGNFSQGQVGAAYTITVTNAGSLVTDGSLVTVTDVVPAGLTPTALAGPGWSCTLATRMCTRSDGLGPGASYPAITLTVDVAGNASGPVTNTAVVSGGGDADAGNNTADDPTTIVSKPDLTIIKTHLGNFFGGQVGAVYTITVINAGAVPTDGSLVTVTDTVPAGLTPTALSGSGWSCTLATRTCTRSDGLGAGTSYPAIALTVDVAANASNPVTNTATVSGGGDVTPGNNTASDLTTISLAPDLAITKTHVGDFTRGQQGATYMIIVRNVGNSAITGTVTVTEIVPAGLTATAFGGPGWNCSVGTPTCTRGDGLANGSSYPAITLTVNVAPLAPGVVTNTVTVSGGGDTLPANNTANDPTRLVFVDVPASHPFYPWVEALVAAGITHGCSNSPPQYCPDADVTRGQIAVFVLRGIHGGAYQPPDATGTMFADVPLTHPLATWIEELAREGITGGCSAAPALYCPEAGITRGEIAVFLLRAKHGAAYQPPVATGLFTDVPLNHPLASWIEQLAREGISTGCGPSTYCPDTIVTREQMAILLVRAFNLPM